MKHLWNLMTCEQRDLDWEPPQSPCSTTLSIWWVQSVVYHTFTSMSHADSVHHVVREPLGLKKFLFAWKREMRTRRKFPCWKKFLVRLKDTPFVHLEMQLHGLYRD